MLYIERFSRSRVTTVRNITSAFNILTEKSEWFACTEAKCRQRFTIFSDFLDHLKTTHSQSSIGCYLCPLKVCNKSCNNLHYRSGRERHQHLELLQETCLSGYKDAICNLLREERRGAFVHSRYIFRRKGTPRRIFSYNRVC